MDRTGIKEHVVRKLKEYSDNRYAVTGDNSMEIESLTVVVSIDGEQAITGRGTGRIAYDFVTGKETTLYISNLIIGITVYAPIDEEAVNVCGVMQRLISSKRHGFINEDIGIKNVYDSSSVSIPVKRESGGRKTWAAKTSFTLSVYEIIEAEPG